jgi:DnaJ-class molecular chaperone
MYLMNRYEVLGLKTDATLDEIKKAYKKLVARTHPDVAGEVMKPLFLSVQDAYETLVDPSKRAAYDLEIGQTRQSPPRTERTTSTQPGPAPRQSRVTSKRPRPQPKPAWRRRRSAS